MARSMKRGVKKAKTYRFTRNHEKNKWKKVKKTRQNTCGDHSNVEWEHDKSTQHNMNRLGLVYNLNKDLPSDSKVQKMQVNSMKAATQPNETVKKLEADAGMPAQKTLRLSQPEIRYCIFLMEKYGENYEAMAKDAKNVYQDTAAQVKRKIDTFKGIPVQFNAYLRSKGFLANGSAKKQEAMDTE